MLSGRVRPRDLTQAEKSFRCSRPRGRAERPRSNTKGTRGRSFYVTHSVLSVGIEPTLQAPQACVLSIERRERDAGISIADCCHFCNVVT